MQDIWKEIEVDWQGGGAYLGRSTNGGQVQIGELDGRPGASPMDLLLMGLAGCTAIDVAMILEKKRQNLQDLRVRVRGKRAADHPKVYVEIEIEYLLWGEGLDPRAVEHAIQLSEEKYCSASAMLGKTAEIRHAYKIVETIQE